MTPILKHNMGCGDYYIYRTEFSGLRAFVAEILELRERPDLAFPLFLHLGVKFSIGFENRDQMRYFLEGLGFAEACTGLTTAKAP